MKDLDEPLKDKDVIVVEDIVDSGRTLSYLLELLGKAQLKSMRLCTLLELTLGVGAKADRRCGGLSTLRRISIFMMVSISGSGSKMSHLWKF